MIVHVSINKNCSNRIFMLINVDYDNVGEISPLPWESYDSIPGSTINWPSRESDSSKYFKHSIFSKLKLVMILRKKD